ncbi:PAS domain-containing hybrid sensor histidine kinase/response regulator [Pseudoduganella namucuonensis]|uniref:Sensory/regulatory protein RpfC n=1 Tax=Pseudoduganella namucuonensis TaxID=1035707 RepID=A0A1I7H6R8_9BURK|nr:PAS domain S-box protein [Pseudoduganella namucuonensis]SFU56410.1 PAS domain S-box-containing protein [Pseudoduganella namucuonensis]
MHETLAAQLRLRCGVESEAAWRALLAELPAARALPGMPPRVAALLDGLEPLMADIGRRYDGRGAELASRERALDSVRRATAELLRHDGAVREPPADDDLEGWSALLPDLARRQQAGRMELLNQRFALDQHAIVSIADTGRRMVYVNDKFCLVTGYQRRELLGQSYAMLDSGQHDAAYFDEVWRTVERGQVWHGEVHNHAKGGRPYCVYATVVPFLDGQGRPYQYVSIETDITENKFLSEIVATSERQYRNLVDSLREVVFQTDARGYWSFVNPAWTGITGYTVDQTLGHAFADFVHPDDQPLARRRFARLLAGRRRPLTAEIRYRTRDGGLRWLEIHARAEVGEGGRVNGMGGTLRDVSERHQAAQQIRENLSFVDALFDSIPLPISLKDADGRFVRVNRAYGAFFGMSIEALRGKTVRDVLPPGVGEVHAGGDRHVLETGEPWIRQDSFAPPGGGEPVDIHVSKAVLRGADQRIRGVITVTVDVTAQAAAVRALRQAKEAADAASQAKSDFLANMSHEIRTPLNSVIGMALLAMKTRLTPRQHDYLDKIRLSGEHLLALIDDILDFSKIEAGMLTLERAPFDLELVLANVLAQVSGRAAAKGLRLDSALEPDVACHLGGDALRLSQVLINLMGNAVKFTERGGVGMRVAALEQDEASCLLHFSVRDSGIGMTAQQLERLFQSFQQGDSSTTRKYGGTGLGLAISKRLVEQMGGQIGVESEAGRGSRFWFTLRLDKEAPPPPRAAPLAVPLAAALRGMRVLVVEDHEFNQQVAREFLEDAGVLVALAGNGMEALALLARERYDCVLMDVQMPVLDGVETVRRMRADPALAGVRVVAMTANARGQDRERCLAAGMDEFISKPVAPDRLYAALAGRAADADAAPPPAPDGAEPEVLSLEVLAESFDGRADRMRQFARRYVETARAGLAEAGEALARGDLAGAAALAHRCKPGAMAVGALQALRLWQALEDQGEGGCPERAGALAAELAEALERVARRVEAEFPAGPDGRG